MLDAVRPVYENPYYMNIEDMSRTSAYELFMEFFGMGDQKTFADRKQTQMNNLKIKSKSQIAALRQQYKARERKKLLAQRDEISERMRQTINKRDWEIAELELADRIHYGAKIAEVKRKSENEITEVKQQDRERLKELRKSKNAKIEEVKQQDRERLKELRNTKNAKIEEVKQQIKQEYRERIEKLAALKNAKIAFENEKYKKYKEKTKERAEVRKFKERIKKDWYYLSDRLLKPTNKEHIPEVMQKAIADFLGIVDIRSNLDDTKVNAKLSDLYRRFTTFEKDTDTANVFEMFSPEFIPRLEAFVATLNEKETTVRDMNAEQLEELATITKMIKTNVQNANKSFSDVQKRTISERAKGAINEIRKNGTGGNTAVGFKKNVKKFELSMTTPYTFFKQLGDTWFDAYWNVRKGLDEKVRFVQQGQEFVENMKQSSNVDMAQLRGKKAKVYDFSTENGQSVSMNKGQIMTRLMYWCFVRSLLFL